MLLRMFLAIFFFTLICQKPVFLSSLQPHIGIMGPMLVADGLGRVAPEIAMAIDGEIDLELLPTTLVGIPVKKFTKTGIPSSILARVGNSKKPMSKIVLFTGHLWGSNNPKEQSSIYKKFASKKNKNMIRVAYTMFESNRIPLEWVDNLNNYFDVVAVPDNYLTNVYKASGVNLPIFVLPMPLNLNNLYTLPLKTEKKYPMVFGSLSAAVERKNLLTTVRAFVKAFGVNNPDVELRINCRYEYGKVLETIRNEIASLQATNIKIQESWVSDEEYLKLLQDLDVYINLSMGEGFSIQPREAMALGIPSIISDNTVHHTICESKLVYAVPSTIEMPAPYLWNGKINTYGVNFNCTIEDAANAFLHVYNNYDDYLNNREKAREWTRQYCPDQIKLLYMNFLMPKKILLGNEDKFNQDFLMTTSKNLYDKFLKIQNDIGVRKK